MSPDKVNRKKQRALLNTVREACVYGEPLLLTKGREVLAFVPRELKESGHRDLDEIRTLVGKLTSEVGTLQAGDEVLLRVDQRDEAASLTARLSGIDLNARTLLLEFRISEVDLANRRTASRERSKESFFVPVLLYKGSGDGYPLYGFARIIDYDPSAMSFELRVPAILSESDFLGGSVSFPEATFSTGVRNFRVQQVRGLHSESRFGIPETTVTVVSELGASSEAGRVVRSLLQPEGIQQARFKVFFSDVSSLEVGIETVTTQGFIGTVARHEHAWLPRFFVAQHSETQIRFNVSKTADGLVFSLTTRSLGVKTQWLNFITHRTLSGSADLGTTLGRDRQHRISELQRQLEP